MRAFLKTHDFSGKDVVVSCCNDGDKGHTLGDLAESMPGSRCIGKIDFQSVLKSDPDSAAERAQQWVKDLLASRQTGRRSLNRHISVSRAGIIGTIGVIG